eukprot:g13266.t1
MAPINRLAGLVLLAIVTTDIATAESEFSVTGASGEEYLVEISDERTSEVIITEGADVPEETTVAFDAEGSVTIVTVGSDTYTISYDANGDVASVDPARFRRRTQNVEVNFAERRLQACEDSCAADANRICGGLEFACSYAPLAALLGPLCNDLDSLCNASGIVRGCDRTCAPSCTTDADCTEPNEVCCPAFNICEVPDITGACGDPHMTGFLGQKFDFTGEDGAWYCLMKDRPSMHLNMRVTAPVPSVPEVTYITGLSMLTKDVQDVDHTIEITVTDPHTLDSSCPEDVSPCLADGALSVRLDGQESLLSPGEVTLGPGVAISAVNLPGACRSFGFEKYWERKKLQNAGGARRLSLVGFMQDMGEWILADPTATNMDECAQYVAAAGETGLFDHASEHASFQIMTPTGTIRLSHGRLHQLAMRDPTDRFDLPEHLTWQMNVAIDHHDVSLEATGILGETVVPVVDQHDKLVMKGMEAIRGSQEDYRVAGPLETVFAQGHHQKATRARST